MSLTSMRHVPRRKSDIVVVVDDGIVVDVQFGERTPPCRIIIRDLDAKRQGMRYEDSYVSPMAYFKKVRP
jgi:hypothetical protein